MRERKRVFYPWFAWNTERIEHYLEEMSAQGWNVERARFSQTWFVFKKGEKQKIRFCADYQWRPEQEYKQILSDDGWELVDHSTGWMIWRKPYNGSRPHLYTDRASLMERNNRIIILIGICLLAQVPAISTNAFERVTRVYLGAWPFAGYIFMMLYALLLMLMIIGLIQLLLLNKRMKN